MPPTLLTLALPLLLVVGGAPVKEDYNITFAVINHNVTGAIFRLDGLDHTADFDVPPTTTFNRTFDAAHRGFWTLYVQFDSHRYAKSPSKEISRDSFGSWIIDVFSYPDANAVGFTHWRKWRPLVERTQRHVFVRD